MELTLGGHRLDCYKDTESTNGMTTMSLAGKIFLLDIDFKENQITRVALSFANTPGPPTDPAHLADSILHKNLSPTLKNPKERPPLISPSLSEFADNLERLAKTDRLSSPPHLNCFTAITGIYRSLLKVFEHEKNNLEGGETSAICKGNGRPRMHVRGKVGLSVEYWKEQRFIPTTTLEEDEEKEAIYRVMIEVAEAPSDYTLNPITPVRTSSHWVSDEIKKPSTDSLFGDPEDTVTDWLEPPLEELPDQTDSRPPSSRFVARLDPPVAVPFQDELQLFNSLMLAPPAGVGADTLEALLFPGTPITDKGRERKVFIPTAASEVGNLLGEEDESVRHRYRLYTSLKPVYARHIYEVPFSHPKELAGIFQILRQFVFVGTLLRSCFDYPLPIPSPSGQDVTMNDVSLDSDDEDLDSFLASPSGLEEAVNGVLPVDISLVEQQGVFGVSVIFPQRGGIASFVVEVGRNADVRVVVDETKEPGSSAKQVLDGRGLERAVIVGEDLGVAVEWVRRR